MLTGLNEAAVWLLEIKRVKYKLQCQVNAGQTKSFIWISQF